jgi:hypothetical protein
MKRGDETIRSQRDLLGALVALRQLTKETGGNYLATLQAEITTIERAVRETTNGEPANRKQLTQFRTMLKAINGLDVKPRKGRRRDLKKIDKVVSQLVETTCEW